LPGVRWLSKMGNMPLVLQICPTQIVLHGCKLRGKVFLLFKLEELLCEREEGIARSYGRLLSTAFSLAI
jgi:hypothetical protein